MNIRALLPKINIFSLRKAILILVLAGGLFGSGYYLGVQGFRADLKKFPTVSISRQLPADKTNLDFSLFWRVWDTISANYFDKAKLNPANMIYGAISGMVSAIGDPYTVFLPPTQNKVVKEDLSGSFEGVGIEIGFKGTQLAVIAPLPGSPAEKAGVKAGDFIVGIKDEEKKIDRGTVGISVTDAVAAIRGKAGTKVTLVLLRDGTTEPQVVEIAREKLEVPTLILTYVGKNKEIADIRLLKFGAETLGEWQKAAGEILKRSQTQAIILDLRNNPGGYLQGAVDIASDFVKNGSPVVIEERGGGARTEFKTERIPLLINYPVVVLINGGSASASEILAGALRDIRKIQIVGEKSFGKGTIQEPRELENGAGIHITIAKWLTPSGIWVNEKGLEPDVTIKKDAKATEDAQLNKAIQLLLR